MKSIDIKLNKVGNEPSSNYTCKLSNRAIIKWEEMNDKPFGNMSNRLNDLYTLLYCCLDVNNDSFKLGYTEFLDILDDQTEVFKNFVSYLEEASGIKESKKKQGKAKKSSTEEPG